jgi:polyhydroxyalkanoate synthesis regulator phasin
MNKHSEFINGYERRQAIEIESLRKKIKELTQQVAALKESNRVIRGTK